MASFTNRLIHESSPYLLQHAHNPVDWYPWGEEALTKARELDLPILVSIGYSACHWCHVMEHESFENEEVAAYMNQHFINIKIDREERPDLDHIYMDAVQAMAGSGGWPLNVFLTSETKPFYGGTYFPPKKAFNRPSWEDVLAFITDLWKNKRGELIKQADILIDHIQNSGNRLIKDLPVVIEDSEQKFKPAECTTIADNILKIADKIQGGFGVAPKFPQTFTIQYLLMYGHFFKQQASVDHAFLSLEKMLQGGIYDHIAGGLARYSTDAEWLAPHFEKMLYDNALLVSVLCDAYQISNKEIFKNGITKTLNFFINEMKHEKGGFYAALDADSEGVEGKFYVWDKSEIDELTGKDSHLCCLWYGIEENGNWEGKNILHNRHTKEEFSRENGLAISELEDKIEEWDKNLRARRNTRIHPSTDDKILLGWNAMLLTAFCKAHATIKIEDYKTEAIRLYDFLLISFKKEDGGFYHTYKNGVAKYPAFLDDLATFIQASIFLQEITGNQTYLTEAKALCEHVITHFKDEETGMFSFTDKDQKDILVRKTEIYDGAVPSGNSIMAECLLNLGVVFDEPEWREMGIKMVLRMKNIVLKYPGSFGIWATLICKQTIGIHEIVLTGKEIDSLRSEILEIYIPNRVFQSSEREIELPLFSGKKYGEKGMIYLCKNYSCGLPVSTVDELKKQIIKEYLNITINNI